MLNVVLLEGFVTKSWRVGGDVFIRIASYRDPDRPRKPLNQPGKKDKPDFVTVRIPPALQHNVPDPKSRVQVRGFIESIDYEETLEDIYNKLGIPLPPELADKKIKRVTTIVHAEQLHILPKVKHTPPLPADFVVVKT